MGDVVKLTEEQIEKIKEINTKYVELTDASSKVLIEKIKLQDRLVNLDALEADIKNKIRENIKNEDEFLGSLVSEHGQIENININDGTITLK